MTQHRDMIWPDLPVRIKGKDIAEVKAEDKQEDE